MKNTKNFRGTDLLIKHYIKNDQLHDAIEAINSLLNKKIRVDRLMSIIKFCMSKMSKDKDYNYCDDPYHYALKAIELLPDCSKKKTSYLGILIEQSLKEWNGRSEYDALETVKLLPDCKEKADYLERILKYCLKMKSDFNITMEAATLLLNSSRTKENYIKSIWESLLQAAIVENDFYRAVECVRLLKRELTTDELNTIIKSNLKERLAVSDCRGEIHFNHIIEATKLLPDCKEKADYLERILKYFLAKDRFDDAQEIVKLLDKIQIAASPFYITSTTHLKKMLIRKKKECA